MPITYVDLMPENAAALEAVLLGHVWAHRWTPEQARQVVEWRYWRRPSGWTRLAIQNGACVGVIDSFLRPYVVAGRSVLVRETCDWWCDARLRPTGLGVRLMRQMMAGEQSLISIGGNDINLELLPRLKWRYIGDVRKSILPLKARDMAAVALRKGRRESLARAVPGFVRIRRPRAVSPPSGGRVCRWQPGEKAPLPEPDAQGVAAVLDGTVLEWLMDSPVAVARVQALSFSIENVPVGFAVIQFEPTPLGTEGKIVHLQVTQESTGSLGWIVAELVRRLADAGAGLVRARSSSAAMDMALRQAGFMIVRSEPVYWWGSDGPAGVGSLQLSYLRADDAMPFTAVKDADIGRHKGRGR